MKNLALLVQESPVYPEGLTRSNKKGITMRKMVLVSLLAIFLMSCAKGQWVKEGATQEQASQDYVECQNLAAVQSQPGTLGDKLGSRTSGKSFYPQECMRGKGYQWITESADGK